MPHQMTPRFAPQLRVYPKHKLNAQASVTGRDTRGWLDREPLKPFATSGTTFASRRTIRMGTGTGLD